MRAQHALQARTRAALLGWAWRLALLLPYLSLVAWALLGGCGGYAQRPPDVAAEREAATDAAFIVWEREVGGMGACWLERDRLRWEVAPEDVLMRECTIDRILSGCFRYDDAGAPVIRIASDTPRSAEQLAELRAHELAHWLGYCSRRWPDVDPEHADEAVWPGMVRATVREMEP